MLSLEGVVVRAANPAHEVLSVEALAFVADLERRFGARRRNLVAQRIRRQQSWNSGEAIGFLPETAEVREGDWRVAATPRDLQDRRVEITGPADRKMMINALNSGAKVFMADLEDSGSPTWANVVDAQINLRDASHGTIRLEDEARGKVYELGPQPAVLVVRPRGWHLDEAHVEVDGRPMSGSLFDFGMAFFHNARALLEKGSGPYYYLPKLEHHLEARLWNDVFVAAQETLGIPVGTIRATVLIETLPAVFQMNEILWELRDHAAGLNAGRWDYIFSCIKTRPADPDAVLPDRAQVSMTVPFMRAYTQLLVATCHRRGAFAMGGMSAFIPNRRDPDVTEAALAAVRADKQREADDGCDGTWVAHPDLVPVATEIFDRALGDQPNQLHRQTDASRISAASLLDFSVPGGRVTEAGLRANLEGAVAYVAHWLAGRGAVAWHNLMEDAATAEISRSQVWQWLHHHVPVDGSPLTADRVTTLLAEETDRIRNAVAPDAAIHLDAARDLIAELVLAPEFQPFLTTPAYQRIVQLEDHA